MRHIQSVGILVASLCALGLEAGVAHARSTIEPSERYVHEAAPPGMRVFVSRLDGPIYTDANGRTLYQWPRKELRNGGTGDMKGAASICDDTVSTENIGLMSPYPPGLTLPDVKTRASCEQVWPPAIAEKGATPIGRWTIIPRKDGRNQWAYDGFVLYTSSLDRKPGDTIGGNGLNRRSSDPPGSPGGDAPVARIPIGPPPDVPGQFVVEQNLVGRQLTLVNGFSVYTWDGDRQEKSNCDNACLKQWQPVLAPEIGATGREDWSVIERTPGVKQWAYRGRPLYTYISEPGPGAIHGIDVPGWQVVYTQMAPPAPQAFTQQISAAGVVLADHNGKTIYIYNCGDDAVDQLACDHPDTPQEYRYAVCGGGSHARCLQTFPYVLASKDAEGENEAWAVMPIDPATGHRAKNNQVDALYVWTYRDRPVFTFARDDRPGSIRAQNWGEFYGQRNGYKAFFLREEFQGR